MCSDYVLHASLSWESASEVLACARADRGQVAFFAALGAVALLAPGPFLWGYALPVSVAGLLSARRLLLEHRYERVADRRPETILRTTADNHLGWLGRLVLAPRNIGCHVVHHLHPRVGLHALPRLREWYRRRYPPLCPLVPLWRRFGEARPRSRPLQHRFIHRL